ncbi:MAG TPA: hypothetical protein VEI97_10975, partial [bacterium]|nr:hypothetical protein [bacterium]
GKLYTELLWQLPNRRTRAAQRHATHLEAVTLSAPGRTTQRLEGDLLRTLRRGDRDALEAFLVPGEGLLLVQGVEGPPAALGCPQGLLRFGLLRPMDRQVDWFVWTPLPFEQLEMLHAIEANVYIDGGDLVGVVWLYGATANGELSRSAWLQLPGPDGVALPAGTWLSPVRAS